jgi:UDPglucose 6-dehydrogenase
MANISIFGTGYVGVVTGACFAQYNNKVICVDVDPNKIAMLKDGKSPIYEPGLEELLQNAITNKAIEFTFDPEYAIHNSDYDFVCVGTPTLPDGDADLTYVFNVAKEIGRHLNHYSLIIDKSTVPVGTGRQVMRIIREQLQERGVKVPFDVVSNPEFLKEGEAIEDFMRPERVVIGTNTKKALQKMKALYAPFIINDKPLIDTNLETAELIKYASNGFLSMKIDYINQLARLCEKIGANVSDVRRGMGTDSRIGDKFLHAGPGYGGSCFPKDTNAMAATGRKHVSRIPSIETTIQDNEYHKQWCAEKIAAHYSSKGESLEGKTFALWGLAFKAKTDDMRDSSSITMINYLLDHHAKIRAHDPEAIENARKLFGERIVYCTDKEEALSGSDALIVMTDWKHYRVNDLETLVRFGNSVGDRTIFDFRNLYYDRKTQFPKKLKSQGITWLGVGISQ